MYRPSFHFKHVSRISFVNFWFSKKKKTSPDVLIRIYNREICENWKLWKISQKSSTVINYTQAISCWYKTELRKLFNLIRRDARRFYRFTCASWIIRLLRIFARISIKKKKREFSNNRDYLLCFTQHWCVRR